MDVPFSKVNILDWHQDFVSSENVIDHVSGLVCWIPLTPVDSKRGSMEICIGSHKDLDADKMKVTKRPGENTSEYLFLPDEVVNKYEKVVIKAYPGDLIVAPLTFVHRSVHSSINDKVKFILSIFSLSCSIVVAPIILLVTNGRSLTNAFAIFAIGILYFFANSTYFAIALSPPAVRLIKIPLDHELELADSSDPLRYIFTVSDDPSATPVNITQLSAWEDIEYS